MKASLFVGAHPDDIELGCGGTLSKYKHVPTVALIMTRGKGGCGAGRDRREETAKALDSLYVNVIEQLEFTDKTLFKNIDMLIAEVDRVFEKYSIREVFTHSKTDFHQDHVTVYRATMAGCRRKGVSIFGYETVSTPPQFTPDTFIDVSKHLEDKFKALAYHRSQSGKDYMNTDKLRAKAVFRGDQINVKYAEGFEAYRIVKNVR